MSSHSVQFIAEPEAVRRVLADAKRPLTSAEVSTLLHQKGGKAFQSVLDAEVSGGRIYSWVGEAYWDRNPMTMARERLLSLAKAEALPAGPLVKRAAAEYPKINQNAVKSVRKQLVHEKALREAPDPIKVKGPKLNFDPQ